MAATQPETPTTGTPMVQAMAHARAAFASLQSHALPPVPINYTVWFEHHAGTRPEMRLALEAAIAAGRVDEALMRELSSRFVEPLPEFTALSAALARLGGTLREATGAMASHGAGTAAFGEALDELSAAAMQDPQRLRAALSRLAEDAREMTRSSQDMGNRLANSTREIEALRAELEDARREAHTDALTGLPNRRAFDERLKLLAGEAVANGQTLALILIDIDHFKAVNDRFGHPVGDALLRRTGSTIKAKMSEGAAAGGMAANAMAARFGGEEFAVLLPMTEAGRAFEEAEKIRLAVAGQSFAMRSTGSRLGPITVSLGLAMLEMEQDVMRLVEQADAALYRAKQEGRNRTCAAQPMAVPVAVKAPPPGAPESGRKTAAKVWS